MGSHTRGFTELNGLRVDLSVGQASSEVVSGQVARDYLGGRGLGAYILLSERIYTRDALAAENPLVFAVGPLTGTAVPAVGRYTCTARSPLTGTIVDGNSGGCLGLGLRSVGLDYLVITGTCSDPHYLILGNGCFQVVPADDLWGVDVSVLMERLQERHGRCDAVGIGAAGENQVLFASIVDARGRQLGRGGLGAVMGSKHLKAVVLLPGDKPLPQPSNSDEYLKAIRQASDLIKSNPAATGTLPRYGTSVLMNLLNELGVLPTRNFRESQFEAADLIGGEALRERYIPAKTACRGCPIGCRREIGSGAVRVRGPEYECMWALGADCGVSDLHLIVRANTLCNSMGLDAISMGGTIACAMELRQVGALPNGPSFGDGEALVRLVVETARRRDLGDELAEGSWRVAKRYGHPELSMQVKALEIPAFDPRGLTGQGLAFATSNRGACHTRGSMLGPEVLGHPLGVDRFDTDGKGRLLIELQNLNAVLDSLVACKFAGFELHQISELLSPMIGEPVDPEELSQIGERIWSTERLFNMAAGFKREDDTLPSRLLHDAIPEGPSKGGKVDLEPMLNEYYELRGWDSLGAPSARKLRELRLQLGHQQAGPALLQRPICG